MMDLLIGNNGKSFIENSLILLASLSREALVVVENYNKRRVDINIEFFKILFSLFPSERLVSQFKHSPMLSKKKNLNCSKFADNAQFLYFKIVINTRKTVFSMKQKNDCSGTKRHAIDHYRPSD